MKLILQAIKALLRRMERRINSTAADIRAEIRQLDSEKIGAQSPIVYGSFQMNPEEGSRIGDKATAEGLGCTATGWGSHAEGLSTKATFAGAHAEGQYTQAIQDSTHAEGRETIARGIYSHAEGEKTEAIGACSHAEGQETKAEGWGSHAEGMRTISRSDCQHVQGKYNIDPGKNSNLAHIVGNGESDTQRSNAHTLDWEGNGWFAGTVEATAMILTSPGGKRFKVTVDDSGTLSAAEVTA